MGEGRTRLAPRYPSSWLALDILSPCTEYQLHQAGHIRRPLQPLPLSLSSPYVFHVQNVLLLYPEQRSDGIAPQRLRRGRVDLFPAKRRPGTGSWSTACSIVQLGSGVCGRAQTSQPRRLSPRFNLFLVALQKAESFSFSISSLHALVHLLICNRQFTKVCCPLTLRPSLASCRWRSCP